MNQKPLKRCHKVLFLLGLMQLLAVLLAGCSSEEPQGTPIDISYLNKNETKLVTETHSSVSTSTIISFVSVLVR